MLSLTYLLGTKIIINILFKSLASEVLHQMKYIALFSTKFAWKNFKYIRNVHIWITNDSTDFCLDKKENTFNIWRTWSVWWLEKGEKLVWKLEETSHATKPTRSHFYYHYRNLHASFKIDKAILVCLPVMNWTSSLNLKYASEINLII